MLRPARLAPWWGSQVSVSSARYAVGVLVLAVAYYAAGRASLALQYEGPVAAIWLPVGVGAAALYLGGLRLWPGALIGDLALADAAQPLGSALGLTAGNMADMLIIAVLLRLLLGRRAGLDRLEHVGGMLVAIVAGAVILPASRCCPCARVACSMPPSYRPSGAAGCWPTHLAPLSSSRWPWPGDSRPLQHGVVGAPGRRCL